MIRTLATLRAETRRRGLPGPLAPIEQVMGQIIEAVDGSDLSSYDKDRVRQLVPVMSREAEGW